MKRGTKFILGVTVALITAASLHFTVGNKFHPQRFGYYGYRGYGGYGWGSCAVGLHHRNEYHGTNFSGHERKSAPTQAPAEPSRGVF